MTSTQTPISFPFQFNPALYRAAVPTGVELLLIESIPRNDRQLGLLKALGLQVLAGQLPADPLANQCDLYQVKVQPATVEPFRSINSEPVFQSHLYLFNLIIALEWDPAPATEQQVRLMAKRASDFLYDATNGYMAIGQVIIGGPGLMEVADIQVMCSNRFHPRAWVDALREPGKFQPIRVGRGIWQKSHETLATWDSPEGFRALAHEWGHYAYGLADQYLTIAYVKASSQPPDNPRFWELQESDIPGCVEIAAPDVALAVESLMANTQISEYAEAALIFDRIHQRYAQVPGTMPPLDGPAELPLPLPLFPELSASAGQRIALGWSAARENLLLKQEHFDAAFAGTQQAITSDSSHWVYLLKLSGAGQDTPDYVSPQGKIGPHDFEKGGFPILGAEPSDQVVLVSQRGERASVQRAPVVTSDGTSGGALGIGAWEDVTPDELAQLDPRRPFFVDVIPEPLANPSGPAQAWVSVELTATQQPDMVRLYPCSQHPGSRGGIDMSWDALARRSQARDVFYLDGSVFVRWGAGAEEKLFICSYSQGGGPGTSTGGRYPEDGGVPISAGSAEGSAMLFFVHNASKLRSGAGGRPVPSGPTSVEPDKGIRIVTTTITIGSPFRDAEHNEQARSYTFSLASNASLQAYPATLVLYTDAKAPQRGGDLLIYRWDSGQGGWQRLTTFVPSDLPYVAIPIREDVAGAAPALVAAPATGSRVERFRIFWAPG